MASDDSSGVRPAQPIVLRIKLRYDDVELMVQRFAANVGKSGVFLPTRSIQPIGAEVKFELRLADDTAVLVGLGRVVAAVPPDPQQPGSAFGMTVELMRVTPQSRALILRMLERRRELGLPELGLPAASDIDVARRREAADTAARVLVETGPVARQSPPSSPVIAPPPPIDLGSGPLPGEGLLTAPRRTAPIAVAKLVAISPLAPEPPRKRRVTVSDLIESAANATAPALPGLDDDAGVDVGAAIARARALAGGSLDAELAALADTAAAPVEISIEAASAELARQLGGSAVRRDRSAAWAPPPATAPVSEAEATEAPAPPDPVAVSEDGAEDGAIEAAAPAEPAAPDAGEAPDVGATVELQAVVLDEGEAPPASDAPEAAEAAQVLDAGDAAPRDAPSVAAAADPGEPERVDVAAEQPADADDAGGDERVRAAADEPARPDPAGADADDDPFADPDNDGDAMHAVVDFAQLDDAPDAIPDELDGFDRTEHGTMPRDDGGFELPAADDNFGDDEPGDPRFAPSQRGEPPVELRVEELDDFEILGETEAERADLRALPPADLGGALGEPGLDFAARLDFGDDQNDFTGEHTHRGVDRPEPRNTAERHAISAGAALALFDREDPDAEVTDDPDAYEPRRVVQPIFDPDPSTSVTVAGIVVDSIDIDISAPHRDDPDSLLAPPPAPSPSPAPRRSAAPRSEPPLPRASPLAIQEAPVEDYELEHALEALDVDLDDLSLSHTGIPHPGLPHAATELQRDRQIAPPPRAAQIARTPAPQIRSPAATPIRVIRPTGHGAIGSTHAPRAPSDDGVDIDFDDDDD